MAEDLRYRRILQAVYGKHMMGDLKAAAEAMALSGIVPRNLRAKTTKSKATKSRRNVKKRPKNKG